MSNTADGRGSPAKQLPPLFVRSRTGELLRVGLNRELTRLSRLGLVRFYSDRVALTWAGLAKLQARRGQR